MKPLPLAHPATRAWLGLIALTSVAVALEFPGPAPGAATGRVASQRIELSNQVLSVVWTVSGGQLRPLEARNRLTGQVLDLRGTEAFRLTLPDDLDVVASALTIAAQPTLESLPATPTASILAERFPGQRLTVACATPDARIAVRWSAELRDGANAVRQSVTLSAPNTAVQLHELRIGEVPAQGARVVGLVPGSPIVQGDWFLALEHPDARCFLGAWASCSLPFALALAPGQPVTHTAALGVVPPDQLRRGFLYYVERERAHPYRPFLHYNAWYDICWGNRKITEAECLRVVEQFGEALVRQRGVPLASFVWDDGWDDPRTLWRPVQANFPNGFTRVLEAARRYGSTLGFWLSPFGGYGQPKEDRLAMGRAQGFETGPHGFSLAGPNYYARFLETCLGFIDHSGANFFKFDGLARSVEETEAMLRLTRALRARKPDLFISITTGTWPSPFWLWYGDSTWRGGGDMGFYGPGSRREQWITYRDLETYRRVVQGGPLYPISSLMNQGFAHARYGTAAEVGQHPEEIRRELRSLFAGGTCLQELYVTPDRMSAQNWDDLAECARWAHAQADLWADVHWVGGDPGQGQVYGWAAWSPRRATLALRNPTAQPAQISLDLGAAFDLPPRAPRQYTLASPWASDANLPKLELEAGKPHPFDLAPFEVLVFEARPR
ncbi:MAG: enterotoxin [Verrucomicrobia bacterium]|nr:enterotoxin [Verrucomicrobiota bacterium]